LPFVFGWDAFIISRDEYREGVAITQEAYDNLFSDLNDLNPPESPARANGSAS
jgi:hypothetical protein